MLIVIAIVALVIFEWKPGIIIVVGLSLPFILYRALPRTARNWLKDYFFLYVAVFIFIAALLLLAGWTWVNWAMPAQRLLINTTLRDDATNTADSKFEFGPARDYSLEARFPALILADDEPTDFTLVMRQPLTSTNAVTVSAVIPTGLRFVAAPEQKELTLVFPPGQMFTRTFQLANTRTDGSQLWGSTQLQLGLTIANQPTPYSVTLQFQAEGALGRATREFVNSTVNDKSPLIILVAALLSGLSATVSNFLKQQKEKDEVKREKYQEELKLFKAALLQKNVEQANAALRELERPELLERADAHLKIVQKLGQLLNAAPEDDIVALVRDTREWPEDCAHAFLICHARLYQDIPNRLREAMAFIPRDQLPQDLSDELAKASQLLSDSQVPYLYSELPQPPLSELPFLKKVLKGINPLPCERAEDDQALLFGKPSSCFWTKHPLFADLLRDDCPTLIFGERGSGKSALAMALGKYHVGSGFRFSLYLPGQPDIRLIKEGYAQHLLSFVQKYPTRLGELTQADLALLARLWASVLGKEYALAEVKAAQISGRWWDNARPPEEKQNLERLGKIQLTLLSHALETATESKSDEPHWPREIGRCAQALGFNQGRSLLVLDSLVDSTEWPRDLLRHLYAWWQAGLTTFVFLPHTLQKSIKPADGITVCRMLTWTPEALRQLPQHRFQEIFRGQLRGQFSSTVFESETVYNRFLKASDNNPQRLVRLWNACLHEVGDQPKIGSAELTAALNHVRSDQTGSERHG